MKEEILKYDPNFTESEFKSFVDNVFIQIFLAVMSREIEKVRHFMTDNVYSVFESRVADLKTRGRIQMYDEINVKSSEIVGVRELDSEILVDVEVISRYMDYLLDENGNYVSGNNTSRIETKNILTFAKERDAEGLDSVRKCQGCGALIDVNANGLCSYCGSTFDLKSRDWVLVAFETR